MSQLHQFAGNVALPLDGRLGFGQPGVQGDEPTGPQILVVDGNPNGVVTATVGTLALDQVTPALWQSRGGTVWEVASAPVSSNIVRVDAVSGDDATAGIGVGVFQTMQAAVDAIVLDNAVPPLGRKGYTLIPSPWQQFDEDLSIDVSNALHLAIQTQGGWMLGNFTAPAWRPVGGAGRDLTFVGDASPVDGIRPSVVLNTTAMTPWNPTSHEAYSGARIAGSILSTIVAGNLELAFEGEVFGEGNVDAMAFGTTIVSLYLREVRLKKPITGVNTNLFKAWDCRFQGLVSVTGYSGIFNCEIEGGMTAPGGLAGVPPQGFFNCDLQGTYNLGGAGNLRLDLASNTTFVDNGAALGGDGTTKKLLNNAT